MEDMYLWNCYFLLIILIITFGMLTDAQSVVSKCNIPECVIKSKQQIPDSKMYSKNGQDVPFRGNGMLVSSPKTEAHCYIDTTKYLSEYFLENIEAIGVIVLACNFKLTVHFKEPEIKLDKVIYTLQIQGCRTTTQSIARLSKAVSLSVLTLHTAYIDTDYDRNCLGPSVDTCEALSKINSYMFNRAMNLYPQQNLDVFFSCNSSFPDVYELIVRKINITDFIIELPRKFPNLQNLEIENSGLNELPRFPWTNTTMPFRNNLTMRGYFLDKYATVSNIEIDPRMYKRSFVSKHNLLTDLSTHNFAGYLQILKLQRNGIRIIGETTFSKLHGVQLIDLSNNKLSVLPNNTFRGLKNLRDLYLQGNSLTYLSNSVFEDLQELVYLNLDNNLLENLSENTFTSLTKLQVLRLDHNLLTDIKAECFSTPSTPLNLVSLNNNPLQKIPDFIFYSRNLKSALLQYTNISQINFTDLVTRISFPRLVDSIRNGVSVGSNTDGRSLEDLRKIDLSRNNILSITLDDQNLLSTKGHRILKILLKQFYFIISDEVLRCDCKITNFIKWVNSEQNEDFAKSKPSFLTESQCAMPENLQGRILLTVQADETYCKKNVSFCPKECSCFQRTDTDVIVVKCQGLEPVELLNETLPAWSCKNLNVCSPSSGNGNLSTPITGIIPILLAITLFMFMNT